MNAVLGPHLFHLLGFICWFPELVDHKSRVENVNIFNITRQTADISRHESESVPTDDREAQRSTGTYFRAQSRDRHTSFGQPVDVHRDPVSDGGLTAGS